MHSATKYLGGHGSAIAGVIVDGGTFDWTNGKFPGFTTPDPSYHGVVFAELGPPAYALKARVQLLRDLGSAASPFNAFLIAQGLETLSLRVERHVANAQTVAEYLAGHEDVISVNYAGLPTSPWYELGKKLAPKGTGAVLAFELAGGIDAGKAFVNALTLHSHVANIGDVRSLVIHPASTTHAQLSPEEQLATGVTPGLVRLAVGIEGIDDILADLEQGFAAAKPFSSAGAADPQSRGGVLMTSRLDTRREPCNAACRRRSRHRRHRRTEAGERRSHRRRHDRRATVGRAFAQPRQRGRRAARTHRRLARHRARPVRATRRKAGGKASPDPARRSTPTAGVRSPPTCWAASADRPARARCTPTESRGARGFRSSRCATRWRPTSPHSLRWASPRSPRWSAVRWAAPGRWSGSSAIPTRCARPWCWPSAPARPPIRSAPRARRSRRSSPIRTGATATTTAPASRRTPAWRSPADSPT